MTNPIMPGIEKLAEKYGIKINPVVVKNDDNKDESFNLTSRSIIYQIDRVKYFNSDDIDYIKIGLTKELLDKGRTHTIKEWLADKSVRKVFKSGLDYHIPSLIDYFSIMNTLRENKDGIFKNDIALLNLNLLKNLSTKGLITNTRIFNEPGINSTIVHESLSNIAINQASPLETTRLSNEDISKKLTGLSVGDLNKTTQWISGNPPLLRFENKDTKSQSIVYLYAIKDFFIINCTENSESNLPSYGIKKLT